MTDQSAAASATSTATPAASAATPEPRTGSGEIENPRIKELSDEAASWRRRFRDAETEIGTLKGQIEKLSTPAATGDEKVTLASLKRRLDEAEERSTRFETNWKQEQEARKRAILDAAIAKVCAGTTNPVYAAKLAALNAKVADDGVSVWSVINDKGEPVEVPINDENLRKHGIVPMEFLPAEGVGGSGTKGSATPVSAGVDVNRAFDSQKYFEEHRAEVLRALDGKLG